MLSEYSSYPRYVSIENELDNLYNNILDTVNPNFFFLNNLLTPFGFGKRRSYDDGKYVISIVVGSAYKKNDIKTSVDGRILKVVGKSEEKLKNGNNNHNFERTYEIPQHVDIKSMKTELDSDGTYRVIFDKNAIASKKEVEDLSTKNEYIMKYNFQDFKPGELSVKVHGRNLIVEGSKKYQSTNEDGTMKYSSNSYISKSISVDDDVDIDKLRAITASDGSLEIHAPRSLSKIKSSERNIQIEDSGKKAKICSK
ncbi:hypothetical protein RF11_05344 [Thelohanellus kitauei]|uniref:SHSP domain-containing protein n=1 Tax=Thelohanellus kitauei TaxID=669202 RepID=A0A0C2JVR5_THEKT|nr:hypothetical protein RF11_05344 [Thelohanellus kitauei]